MGDNIKFVGKINKNIAIIVLIIVVAVGAFLFLKQNKTSKPKSITLAEVAKHKDAKSCWMAIEGNVYDVTAYIPNHPGGEATVLRGCGKDATSMFNNRPDGTSHSDKARTELTKYQIGVLSK